MSQNPQDEPPEVEHPPLEDFTVTMPSIRFYNYSKLFSAKSAIKKLQNEIKNFKKQKAPSSFIHPKRQDDDFDGEEEELPEREPLDCTDASYLQPVPPLASSSCDYELTPTQEFLDIIHKQAADRYKMSDEFRREERMVLSNYYDAQLREHMQKNESVDHRPVSDALRYVSKVHAFPMDVGGQRFYKFNIRYDKMIKKHKKALEKLGLSQDLHAECLLQYQIHEVLTYGDINKIPVENVKIPKLPIPDYE